MTNISAHIFPNKRSFLDRLKQYPRYTVELHADERPTEISYLARTMPDAMGCAAALERDGLMMLSDFGLLDGIERETFRIKHHLDPLPKPGDVVELTVDIGMSYKTGMTMRVQAAEYVLDIKSEENRYPVMLLPEDEWQSAKAKDPALVLGIPVNIDEYKVVESKLVSA